VLRYDRFAPTPKWTSRTNVTPPANCSWKTLSILRVKSFQASSPASCRIIARRNLNRIFTRRAANLCQSGVSERLRDVSRLMEPFFVWDARTKSVLQPIRVDVHLDNQPP
jgi:hypothetical protein